MISPYFVETSQGKDEKRLLDEKYYGKEVAEYEQDKKRLASGEPLAYVIGWQPFLGLKIYLDSKPLIPRPETEWWTEKLVCSLQEQEAVGLKFLDLCAGSGAIGCAALARLPDAQVYFGEIDPAHETTIIKNIRENKLDLPAVRQATSRTTIRIGDLFEPFDDIKFDIIAANPPYVPAGRVLPISVANYEPALALFAGDDGLDYTRRIARELPKRLNRGGFAWIECDSPSAETTSGLFTAQGLSAEIRNDQYGEPRIVVVSF